MTFQLNKLITGIKKQTTFETKNPSKTFQKPQRNHTKMKLLSLFVSLFLALTAIQAAPAPVLPEDPPYTHFVHFTINHGDEEIGTIKIGLFGSIVPKTVKNFYTLATTDSNEAGAQQYRSTIFHRIIKNFMIQGGDYENANGTGGKSIYGAKFDDENFELTHDRPGRLSMANAGPGTNGAQFFITTVLTPWLNGKHVVFGQVVEGLDLVLEKIQTVKTAKGDKPVEDVTIVKSWGEPNDQVNDKTVKEYEEEKKPELSDNGAYFIFFACVALVTIYMVARYYNLVKIKTYASLRD